MYDCTNIPAPKLNKHNKKTTRNISILLLFFLTNFVIFVNINNPLVKGERSEALSLGIVMPCGYINKLKVKLCQRQKVLEVQN